MESIKKKIIAIGGGGFLHSTDKILDEFIIKQKVWIILDSNQISVETVFGFMDEEEKSGGGDLKEIKQQEKITNWSYSDKEEDKVEDKGSKPEKKSKKTKRKRRR